MPKLSQYPVYFSLALVMSALGAGSCKLDLDTDPGCESGQCDIFTSIRELLEDIGNVDLNDLITATVGLATDEMNDAIELVQVDAAVAYGLDEEVVDDITVESINDLVSGLVARFGREELTTEVTQIRQHHLEHSSDRYFVESAIALQTDAYWNWALKTEGFGLGEAQLRDRFLGFSVGAELKTRIVGAYEGEIRGILGAPLVALKAGRGFLLPKGIHDLKQMSPGESVAFSGEGHLGLNIGSGVPVFVANPTTAIGFSLVVSGALRTLLEGRLDVQLVKMPNQELVVDVGMEHAFVKEANVALTPGWGVSGLVQSTIQLDSLDAEIDLGRILDKGLRKRLERKVKTVEVQASREKETTRLTVARFRFMLNALDDRAVHALARASRGDVRLAQNLAARGGQGIVVEFDLDRTGVSSSSYLGANVFGLNFFDKEIKNDGAAVLQTPGGARTLLWDSLHRSQGTGFPAHGYTRTGLAGLTFKEQGAFGDGETNLFLRPQESDRFMERTKMLSHVDALLMALVGQEAFGEIQSKSKALTDRLYQECPLGPAGELFYERCNIDLIENDREFLALKDAALGSAEEKLLSNVSLIGGDGSLLDFARRLVRLKLGIHSVQDPDGFLYGPRVSVATDVRMDDIGLGRVMNATRIEFENALREVLVLTENQRSEFAATQGEELSNESTDAISSMGAVFERRRIRHNEYTLAEEGFKDMAYGTAGYSSKQAEVLKFATVDNRPNYESVSMSSVAQLKSENATRLFDELMNLSDAAAESVYGEKWLTYSLLRLVPPSLMNVNFEFHVDTDGVFNGQLNPRVRYDAAGIETFVHYARGERVSPLFGELFDIDGVINLQDD